MAPRRYITFMPIIVVVFSMAFRTRIVTMVPVLGWEVNYWIDRCCIGRLRIVNWLRINRLLNGRWLIASYVYYYPIARLAVY